MVSRITILEPHFDGAQFGPSSIGEETESDESEGSGSRKLLGFLLLGVLVAGIAIWRANAGDGGIDLAEEQSRIKAVTEAR